MNDEEKKSHDEPVEIKPVPDAEIEYLTGPDTPPPAASADSPPKETEEAKQAKDKPRKKESDARVHREPKDLRKEVEHLKAALKEVEARAAALEAESSARQVEAAEYKDKFMRMAAEAENIRKRVDREKNEFFQYALADLLKDIIQVMDNFERALKAGDETDGRSLREGVELIYKQLVDLVRKQGVTLVVREGRHFDPEVHQAVSTEESEEVTEAVVGEELQKGYMLNDRLLRPALVKVLLPKKGSDE
jgi:molecular chaperone GrpE